jgi:hypothetical protein
MKEVTVPGLLWIVEVSTSFWVSESWDLNALSPPQVLMKEATVHAKIIEARQGSSSKSHAEQETGARSRHSTITTV